MSEFRLPLLGADTEQGTLLQWKVAVGDRVKRGDVIGVIDTAKAAIDLEIWQDGVIEALHATPGQEVHSGDLLATLSAVETDNSTPIISTPKPAATPLTVSSFATVATPVIAPPTSTTERVRITPAARKKAAQLGVDVHTLCGDGVLDLARITAHTAASATTATETANVPCRSEQRRRAMALLMSRSKREIPHYYLSHTVSVAAMLSWLSARNASLPITARVVPAVVLLKAAAHVLRDFPEFNGWYRQERLETATTVDAGIAIALRGGGLLVPTLCALERKSLADVMQEFNGLVSAARRDLLRSSQLAAASVTFTVLGELGVDNVFGVIFPPQLALLGFGSIRTRPMVRDDKVLPEAQITLSLAADHRCSDGHRGAALLRAIDELLQQPQTLEPAHADA